MIAQHDHTAFYGDILGGVPSLEKGAAIHTSTLESSRVETQGDGQVFAQILPTVRGVYPVIAIDHEGAKDGGRDLRARERY